MENVKKFYDALSSDETMRDRAKALNGEQKDEATVAAEIVAFAKSEGYDFTAEDLTAFVSTQKTELSDEELEAVAGGVYKSGDCFCALGGGKDPETGRICACVISGGGKKDNTGKILVCGIYGEIL